MPTEQNSTLPGRIISLVPSQTELLYTLGLDKEVIGITKFCIHPDHWFRNKKRIGGTKTVNVELIRSLKPDLVIANKEENVQEQVEAIMKFAPVYVSDISTVAQALHMIREIGRLTGSITEANLLVKHIEKQFNDLQPASKLKAAYFIWRDPWMTVGNDTFIHDMISKAGWENVYKDSTRYPVTSLKELAQKKPNVVLLSSEPYPFREKHISEVQEQIPHAKIILVDGEMFSWYGSHMQYAPAYIQGLTTQLLG